MTLFEIPANFPEIIDSKFYKVTMESFGGTGPPFDCAQPKLGEDTCCKTGTDVNDWIDNDRDCKVTTGFCPRVGVSAQRLVNIEGPFDDLDACTL